MLAVEIGEDGQAGKTALGQLPALLPAQHRFEAIAGADQPAHITGGIGELDLRQLLDPAPIRTLGPFVQLHTHQLIHHILEPMAGAIGAGQPAGHLGAEERRHGDAQPLGQGRQVETGEMEHLLDSRIFQQQLEPRRSLLAPGDADATGVVVLIT